MAGTLDLNTSRQSRTEVVFPFAVVLLLVVLVVPLPTIVLDMLLTLNIGIVMLLLLVTLNVKSPLELSVFPSAILLLTLTRLSLNVATTRLILLQADAGKIVASFGNFVVGGELIVGLVVFLILVIIQFVVITKGATRISEVAARFVLDAMPGKQMAIDADLNAGVINETESRRRREALSHEAEFYGSMDGASKFVRGDAIAGLIITAVNLIGGIAIGLMNSMSIGEAVRTYSILTVGDGLVSQIPALVVAIAAGMLITKSTTEANVGTEIRSQFFGRPLPLYVGCVILVLLCFAPGFPKIPFLGLALVLVVMARRLQTKPPIESAEMLDADEKPTSPMEDHVSNFLETDRASIEIGARLIPLVDPKRGIGLLKRITTLRRDVAVKSGLWIPLIRIRDNIQLEPEEYRILIGGQEIARGDVRVESVLALHPDGKPISLSGQDARDPAFGLPAKWIGEGDRAQAELLGCTVVDAQSVIITHMREVLRQHAGELLSREDLNTLIDRVRQTAPSVVDELIPNLLSPGTVHRVLILLLRERVSITNLVRIFESLAHHSVTLKDPEELAERVRGDLARTICEPFLDSANRIHAIVFEPLLELEIRRSLQDGQVAMEAGPLERLIVRLGESCREASLRRQEVCLLVDSSLRRPVRRLLARSLAELSVISFFEVPPSILLEAETVISKNQVFVESASTLSPS